ncbi:Double RNA binding domain protein 7 [Trypanosoma cruzi]|uniref:RNA-binding protein, putative n=2 Tax=Trypanosoma cruzi TaxID=5693 RepID=Q4D576_TRYCC|nr:RNA-binding protein, putative [Trypanosoma cruzi]EAN87679.1 RNA-binding protein, putative [Trypanosoma cruzi]PWV15351.1 Double RNA binding domain protein 7 [Trypanosoma cruzi]RNC46090.1 putative RNA-binding protein [Trypanosoma cruzi]|eukprot:XP_809530.1 RNA-binding protein [Trypanosoma cruzi strain CL Brener]
MKGGKQKFDRAIHKAEGMDGAPPNEVLEPLEEVYKPSLRVDVTAEPPEENENSTGTTPVTSVTPHVSTNIFVAGLPPSWDENDLRKKFQEFGEIISTKLVRQRHFAFVMFRRPESAHAAINATHLTHPTPNSSMFLHVSIAMHDEGVDEIPNDRVFIRGLPQWANKDHLRHCFSRFGSIVDSAVLMNPLGQCKGSGFVQFSSIDEATEAIKARKTIRIENWDAELEIKYSETAEVRQQRQERNKNRQRHSPKYGQHQLQYQLFNSSASVVSPIPAFPVLGMSAPFPFFYPRPALSPAASPHIIYSPMVPSPVVPVYPSPPVVFKSKLDLFPSSGDLLFTGVSLTESTLLSLLQCYGKVDSKDIFDDAGAAVRMVDRGLHLIIVQQLNGTIFPDGKVMSVVLYP